MIKHLLILPICVLALATSSLAQQPAAPPAAEVPEVKIEPFDFDRMDADAHVAYFAQNRQSVASDPYRPLYPGRQLRVFIPHAIQNIRLTSVRELPQQAGAEILVWQRTEPEAVQDDVYHRSASDADQAGVSVDTSRARRGRPRLNAA